MISSKKISSNQITITSLDSSEFVEIVLPDKIQAVVGDRIQLFIRGMIKAVNPYNYNVIITCSKGMQFPRYYDLLPISADIGNHNFKIDVKNNNGDLIATKTCILEIKSNGSAPSTSLSVLCIGDSLTSNGEWVIEADRRLTKTGGTPIGRAFSNILFKGRKNNSSVGWEGTGGWSWWEFTTAGRNAFRFQVSGITTTPSLGSVYTNNGVNFTVDEVNITSGAGNIRTLYTTGTPQTNGILTKVSGDGDLTINYSSSAFEAGNPFWDSVNNNLNISNYVDTYMNGDLDIIYILLSWNGHVQNKTNFDTEKGYARTLFNHIKAEYPNVKIKMMGIQLPSQNGGMGANYGASGVYSDTYGMSVTAFNQNKAYQELANESLFSDFVEFVNVSAQFDSENNMQETDVLVNTRSAKTEKRGTNGVHPALVGYYQIADVVYRNFIARFCQ